MWILLKPDDDGNHIQIVRNIRQLMSRPEDYGVADFRSGNWFQANPDPRHWASDTGGILLWAEVVLPEAVTAKFTLPDAYPYED